jgi:hypothetical protein
VSDKESDGELAADVLDLDGKLARWLENEQKVYLAHAGRDGTREGFRQHVAKMVSRNPELMKMG